MNGESVEATNGVLSLGSVITGSANSAWNGDSVNYLSKNAIYTHIASDGTMTQGILKATQTTEGVVTLYNTTIQTGNYNSDYYKKTAASVYTVAESYYAIAGELLNKPSRDYVVSSVNGKTGSITISNSYNKFAANGDIVPSKLSGHDTFEDYNGNIYLYDGYVNVDSDYLNLASLPSNCARVENNFMYNSSNSIVGQIKPERFISGFYANEASGLTSWVGDMPNLEFGYGNSAQSAGLFESKTQLTTFIGDLSSLTQGYKLFYDCTALTTFIGDLSSLTNG